MGDTTFLQVQDAVKHSKKHHPQVQCKLLALIAHATHISCFHPISYTCRHSSLSCSTNPSGPSSFQFFLRYGLSYLTKVIAHCLLHPARLSAPATLNSKADASLGVSAGVCPNEPGVKSLPSGSLLSSHRLSSVSNMLDVFPFFSKKKKSNLFSNYKRI